MLKDTLPAALLARGISRRDLLRFSKLMVATLAAPPLR